VGDVVPITTDPRTILRALLAEGRDEFLEALQYLEARQAERRRLGLVEPKPEPPALTSPPTLRLVK
jgi:hypothetical protein